MPPAATQDLVPPGEGGAQRLEDREGVRIGKVVELQLPHPVPSEFFGSDVPQPFSGEKEDLEGARLCIEVQEVPDEVCNLGVRDVGVVEHENRGDPRELALHQDEREVLPSLRRTMEDLGECGVTRSLEQFPDVPENVVR